MKNIYSKAVDGLLLHIINRKEDILKERSDIVSTNEFIQLSTLRLSKGKTFKPHAHIWKDHRQRQNIAQESWVVISGKVRCHFYDVDDKKIAVEELNPGDASITLYGGHTYEILEDDTIVYEYKTGPYFGQEYDKRFLNDVE